ncbi:MAG: trypsin-like serine protease [Pusillimonas sp.]|nr:trypsin-like serine protease [Pusillimonas sp.]
MLLVFSLLPLVVCARASGASDTDARTDNRVALTSDAVTDYEKAVGQIRATGSERTRHCTGTAIAPRFVLTVVHCLFNDLGEPYGRIDFFPGSRASNGAPFGSFPVLRYYRPVQYELGLKTAANLRYDLALVEVGLNRKGERISEAAAVVPFRAATDAAPGTVTILGYPNDKELYGAYIQSDCGIRLFARVLYRTECFATKGQSGSPVLVYDREQQRYYVQGVLSGVTKTASFATRITQERQAILQAIVQGNYAKATQSNTMEKWRQYYVGSVP